MGFHADYREGLLARFADRETLNHDDLYQLCCLKHKLNQVEVFELFALIEEAYKIPAGLLRPSDQIVTLTRRVPEKRWWKGPFHDVVAGDREFWLQEELDEKLQQYGLWDRVTQINTFDELVHAWCGIITNKD